jgi:hypothetical protein
MINWPKGPDEAAQHALEAFKKSSLATEMQEDAQHWSFRAYARSTTPPARMVLHSDAGETRIFSLEMTGFWRRVVDQDVRS